MPSLTNKELNHLKIKKPKNIETPNVVIHVGGICGKIIMILKERK